MTRLEELPDLVTVEDYGRWAGIGRRQAYESVHRGDVRSIRIGRSLRIPRTSLEALVNGSAPAADYGEGVEQLPDRADDQGARGESSP